MSFINPFLLIGIIAAGIPLLIHLWSRRQAKLVDFSSIKFLMSLNRKKVKRLKLKQILILILRMLIILSIALALARPVFTSRWASAAGGRAKNSVAIVLDNSYSMSYEGLDGNRFEIAKDRSLRILDSLRSGDSASLILMSDFPDVIFKKLTSDIQQIRDAVKNARISHRNTYILPSISEAYKLLKESKNPRKKIYLISDLGENGWHDWKNIPPDSDKIDVSVIRIGEKKADNRAVENISLSNEFVGVGMPVQITAKINGSDTTQAEFFVDSERKGQVVTNKGSVSFTHVFQHPGTHTGEIHLASDRLSLDDIRYYAVDVLGQIKVLSAGDDKFYVNLALNPAEMDSANPEAQFLIMPSGCSIDELGSLSLSQYSVVVLADADKLTDKAVQNLKSFCSNGGNIIVFLGKKADRDWYNSQFDLLPASIGSRTSFSQNPLRISRWSSDHPIFKIFRDEGTAAALKSPLIYSAFSVIPKSGANILASFDRNIPAIIASAGNGKVFLFNVSPDPGVSDLALKPAFLPLIQQTIFYLVSKAQEKNILVGNMYLQNIKDSSPEILDPENNVIIPVISSPERDKASQIQYDSASRAGIYKLEFKSKGSLKRDYFAVNLNTAGESDLRSAKDEDVISKLGTNARFISSDNYTEEIAESGRIGSEFSSRLLILAVILMLVEIALANRRRIAEEES